MAIRFCCMKQSRKITRRKMVEPFNENMWTFQSTTTESRQYVFCRYGRFVALLASSLTYKYYANHFTFWDHIMKHFGTRASAVAVNTKIRRWLLWSEIQHHYSDSEPMFAWHDLTISNAKRNYLYRIKKTHLENSADSRRLLRISPSISTCWRIDRTLEEMTRLQVFGGASSVYRLRSRI